MSKYICGLCGGTEADDNGIDEDAINHIKEMLTDES